MVRGCKEEAINNRHRHTSVTSSIGGVGNNGKPGGRENTKKHYAGQQSIRPIYYYVESTVCINIFKLLRLPRSRLGLDYEPAGSDGLFLFVWFVLSVACPSGECDSDTAIFTTVDDAKNIDMIFPS